MIAAAGAVLRPRGRSRDVGVGDERRHTLLITVDRWTPVPEILGVFRAPGEAIAVSNHLHLLCLDRLDLTTRSWSAFTALLVDASSRSKMSPPALDTVAGIDAAEVVALPGIDDFLLMRRIRDEAVSGRWHRIVVDLSGVGDPYAVLDAGSVLRQALNRLWPRHRRLSAAAERPAMAQLTAALDAIDRDCADVTELLTDATAVAVHLVVGADDRGARLLPEHLATIDLLGLPLTAVHVNEGVSAVPREIGAEAVVADPAVTVRRITRSVEPLDRAARLRKLAVALGDPNGCARGTAAAEVTARPADHADPVYELAWSQRLPRPDELMLGRSGDDLLVTVSGVRHCLGLPSVLRRCVVVDASWDGGRLHVLFRPDPAVWPRR
ncbi:MULTISPECIES: ArsA family ATPase [unclassified Gordonia (in: high G+C Gram-positive bacteria)]